LYYGQVEPNTADAKLGIYASVWESSRQGLDYLADWVEYEPVAAVAAAAFLSLGLVSARDWRHRAFLLGLVTYAAYVVFIGGDFMRGRLFLPSFTGACVFGALAFVRWRPAMRAPGFMALTTGLVVILGVLVSPHQDGGINDKGIANERLAYSGYGLSSYIEHSELTNRVVDLDLALSLAKYAEACGPVTIHHANPGTLGYLAGPDVTLIDTMGLTDEVIAALPRSEQVDEHPRPGHPTKRMPVSYLARRGDISLFAGWTEAVEQLDCNFRDYPRLFVDSTDKVLPNVVYLVVTN
jgi:arabinofuranosyltransferase